MARRGRSSLACATVLLLLGGLGAPAALPAKAAGTPSADVSITDSVPPLNVVGEAYADVLTVHNAGPDASGALQVSLTITTRTDLVSVTTPVGTCGYAAPTRTITCVLGSLVSGASATIRVILRGVEVGGYFQTAFAFGSVHDAQPLNNYAPSSATIVGRPADATLSVRAPRSAKLTSKRPVVYRFTVRNRGRYPGIVSFRAHTPKRLRLVSARVGRGTCAIAAHSVFCRLGTLAPRATRTVVLRARPRAVGRVALTGSVLVSGTETVDPDTSNNAARAQTVIVR